MKAAVYHRPEAEPKLYPAEPGEVEGTVNLLRPDGRVLVRGVRIGERTSGGYVTLPADEVERPKASRKSAPRQSAAAPAPADRFDLAEGAD